MTERTLLSARRSPATGTAAAPALWLTPDLLRVFGAASAWGFAFSTFYLLPKFLTQVLGAAPAETGLVVGTFGIATVGFTPLAGRCVDSLPRRHALIAGSVLMAAAAFGFLGVHAVGPLVLALRIVQGASYALVVTAVGAVVSDLAPRERLGQALGLSGSSMLIMNAIAPAVAEPLAAVAGWRVVFGVATAAAGLAAALGARVTEPAAARPVASGARGGMLQVLGRPLVRHYATVITLSGAAFGAVFTFQQPYALELGRTQVGGFFVAYAAAAIAVRLGFGHLPDRLGPHRVALAALVAYALVVLAMAGMRPWELEPLGALFGLAHGVFYPAVNATAVAGVPRHERGRLMAIFTGAFSLGLWIGATLLGVVADRFGYPPVFVVAALGTLTGAIVLARSRELRVAGRRGAWLAERTGAVAPRLEVR